MLPASVKGPGMNMGFPDVCLTPSFPAPIPIPYPNMGMHAMAAPFCATILNTMMPALNMGSMIPMTLGDQPGVANPMFMQMGTFTMGSPKVILQGMPAITLTSTTTGNNMNNPVGAVLVPGAPTILYGYAGTPAAPASSGAHATLPSPGTGHIAVRAFSHGVPAAVHAAIVELTRRGIERLVFDLRDNPGGEILTAVEILRDLLPAGALVATIEDADGDALTYRARGDVYPLALAVLVNRGTASAAELFAGCLKAHGRAVIVGETTHGKGTACALIAGSFRDVGRVRLPGGVALDVAGVVPDRPELPPGYALAGPNFLA
jgi:carboxyl-terminal processing protease